MMWRQFLFSKKVCDRPGSRNRDDFHVMTANGLELFEILKPIVRATACVREIEAFHLSHRSGPIIGLAGRIGSLLGDRHRFAMEISIDPRPITFVQAFQGSRRSPLPLLSELVSVGRSELEKVLDLAHHDREPVRADGVRWQSSTRRGESAWSEPRDEGFAGLFDLDDRLLRVLGERPHGAVKESTLTLKERRPANRGPQEVPPASPARLSDGHTESPTGTASLDYPSAGSGRAPAERGLVAGLRSWLSWR